MPEHIIRQRPDPQKSLVGFVVGDVHYAIDIIKVRQIVNPLGATPLPHTPEEVAGLADYRGEDVPIIDLRVRFGLPPQAASRGTKWILVSTAGRTLGLVVDEVTEVFGANNGEIRPSPDVGGDKQTRGIAGVTTHNGRLTFVLDTQKFTELFESLAARGVV